MRAVEIIGGILLAILLIVVFMFIAGAQAIGAQDYLENHGYMVSDFHQDSFNTRCTASKERRSYSFRAQDRNTQEYVEGYICYGGLSEAVIHIQG